MKNIFKPVVAAGLVLIAAAPIMDAPAMAQAQPATVKDIGVVDLQYVAAASNAYKTAEQQRPEYYKAYYDQAKQRSDAIEAQLKPLVDKLRADSQAANPDRTVLQQQAAAIQQIDQQGQRELSQIMQPVALSQEYVDEQLEDVLPRAIEAAAQKRGVGLIFNRGATVVYRSSAYDMNQAVVDELNTLLPVAQLVPPPGWLPRQLREQQAAQAAAANAGAAANAAPAQPAQQAGPAADSR